MISVCSDWNAGAEHEDGCEHAQQAEARVFSHLRFLPFLGAFSKGCAHVVHGGVVPGDVRLDRRKTFAF